MTAISRNRSARRLGTGLACVLGLVASATAWADTTALEHVRLIDGNGGAPAADVTVLIDGGRIAAVGPAGQVTLPAGTRRIDLAGRTLMPGMVSDHSHLGMTDGTSAGPQNYNRGNIERQLRQFQRYGVTTVTSLGLNGPLFQTLREQAHAGIGVGADVFGADRGIGVPEGAPPVGVGPGTSCTARPRRSRRARQCATWPRASPTWSRSGWTTSTTPWRTR